MESQDVVLHRHLVEENGKYPFLHLTSIFRAQDDHLPVGEIDGDRGCRGHASGESISWEGARVVDHVVGVEGLELLGRWADEHVPHEQCMIGSGAHDTDIDAVPLVPSSEAVNDVDSVPCVQVIDGTLSIDSPNLERK